MSAQSMHTNSFILSQGETDLSISLYNTILGAPYIHQYEHQPCPTPPPLFPFNVPATHRISHSPNISIDSQLFLVEFSNL